MDSASSPASVGARQAPGVRNRDSAARRFIEGVLEAADVRLDGQRPWDIQIFDTRMPDRVLAHGTLGLGEAYMDGHWTCERLDELFDRLLRADIGTRFATRAAFWHHLRARLLNRLGAHVRTRKDLFGRADRARPGGLFDVLYARARDGVLDAPAILDVLLEGLGPIWEGRPALNGVPLGDCWPVDGFGYTPLHKLSQWLAYSLIEPLERAGVRVDNIDGLTGLAEYRNGGLFVDAGVLAPRDPLALTRSYNVSDPFVVAWRSLTVALLDRIAPLVRDRLGVSADAFPLARVLEGGTWAAGRALARERRADSGPPFTIISDGTVF